MKNRIHLPKPTIDNKSHFDDNRFNQTAVHKNTTTYTLIHSESNLRYKEMNIGHTHTRKAYDNKRIRAN